MTWPSGGTVLPKNCVLATVGAHPHTKATTIAAASPVPHLEVMRKRLLKSLRVNHQKLPIAIDLAVTTCEIGYKPQQVQAPDAAEPGWIDAVIETFDFGITLVE